jgi:hypothetical protein
VGGKFQRSSERIASLEAKVRQHNLEQQESVFGPQGRKKTLTTAELRVKCSTLKQQCAALKKSSREALEMKDQQLVAMKAMADEQRRLYERSIDDLVGAGRPSSGSGATGAAHLRESRRAARNAAQRQQQLHAQLRQSQQQQQQQQQYVAPSRPAPRSRATVVAERSPYRADDSLELEEEDAYDEGRSPAAQYGGGRGGVSWQTQDADWDER